MDLKQASLFEYGVTMLLTRIETGFYIFPDSIDLSAVSIISPEIVE